MYANHVPDNDWPYPYNLCRCNFVQSCSSKRAVVIPEVQGSNSQGRLSHFVDGFRDIRGIEHWADPAIASSEALELLAYLTNVKFTFDVKRVCLEEIPSCHGIQTFAERLTSDTDCTTRGAA